MKIITATLLVSLVSLQTANAQTTTQQLPPLPTTQPAAQPIYAPVQKQAQAMTAEQQAQFQQFQAWQAQQAAAAQNQIPVIAPAYPTQQQQQALQQQQAQPLQQQQVIYTAPAQAQPAVAPQTAQTAQPAVPSHTVTKKASQQAWQPQPVQQFAQPQPAQQQPVQQQQQPQQFQPAVQPQPIAQPAQQVWQAQPAQQQFIQPQAAQAQPQAANPLIIANPQPTAAAQTVTQPAQASQPQPQQLQQFQPASGQQPAAYAPVAQPAPQAQAIAPQPIAVPAPKAAAEPVAQPSTYIANAPTTHSGSALYMLATVSPAVPMAKASLPKDAYKTLDEDAWRQIEFVPASNSTNITNLIGEVIKFKQQNWAGEGFRNVMVRPELPVNIQQLQLPKSRLPKAKATSLALKSGSVSDGFTISDAKSGWFLYGQKDAAGKIVSLAVSPDDKPMSEAFAKQIVTTAGADLILVDWYKDTIVDTRSAETVLEWSRIYKPSDLVKN